MGGSSDGSTAGYAGRIEVLKDRRAGAHGARRNGRELRRKALCPARGPKRRGGTTRSSRIEMVVDGVPLLASPDIDEAELTQVLRAIRAASQ